MKLFTSLFIVVLASAFCEERFLYPCDFIQSTEWETIQGEGMTGSHTILILENTLDTQQETGEKTFLYQLSPGAEINSIAIHDTWEQVIIVSGQLVWLSQGEAGFGHFTLEKGAYVDRPPNVEHGPFRAGPEGCLMVVRYHY